MTVPKIVGATASSLSAITMVTSVKISNFRGFEELTVDNFGLVNVIVGDNGAGKTALLEAMYLALSGHAQQPTLLRGWRGQNISFTPGMLNSVVEGLYADLFHNSNSEQPITISLVGREFENRQLTISKTGVDVVIKTEPNRHDRRAAKSKRVNIQDIESKRSIAAVPILMTWTDQHGTKRDAHVNLNGHQLSFDGTGEVLPNCFMYPPQANVSPTDLVGHYSALIKKRQADRFKKLFMSTFDDVTNIDLGDGVVLADVPWSKDLVPLPLVSGGTNRAAAIMLSISHRDHGLIMIDEVENGLFHKRQTSFSSVLIEMAREYDSQLFMTTHSDEWLRHFMAAARGRNDDIVFWRMYRDNSWRTNIRRFTFEEFETGMAAGEMR